MAKVEIHTTVDVSLSEISTSELKRELANRGCAIDDEAIERAKTSLLIKELQERSDWTYEDVPIAQLIEALHHFGCPDNLIEHLEAWAKTPIANKEKLEKWIALSKVK